MPTKNRIKVRGSRDYDIKLVGKKGAFAGEIEEVTWYPASDNKAPEGFIDVGLSIKIKTIDPKSKATPRDIFTLNVVGKPGSRYSTIAETLSGIKLINPAQMDKEEAELPQEFEQNTRYSFTGMTLAPEENL